MLLFYYRYVNMGNKGERGKLREGRRRKGGREGRRER